MSVIKNTIAVNAENITVLTTADQYKNQLLSLITNATQRIYITALYLQDDEAGREVLHALFQAKQKNPQLDIKVFVDFHRAQRGLIGEQTQLGNRALYLQLSQQYQHNIDIYGVAVKQKELFGVLHLKGMVFDNTVLYTGASINNVYCQQHNRYRLDRYYLIESSALATSFCQFLQQYFVTSQLATLLNQVQLPPISQIKRKIKALKLILHKAVYPSFTKTEVMSNEQENIVLKPLVGLGKRGNKLNKCIRKLIQESEQSLIIFTPYFNFPKPLVRDVFKALRRGVQITLVVGDKSANDFFIKNEDDFGTIGIVPYIYETLLRRFIQRAQPFIDKELLTVHLWKDGDNSFHLKGLISDQRYHLLTGNNLNPRAWSLDLENGILLDDVKQSLMPQVDVELENILVNTRKISHASELEAVHLYPEKPQKLLKKIQFTQIDRILKRFL